jgi:hypothetical protein
MLPFSSTGLIAIRTPPFDIHLKSQYSIYCNIFL